MIVSKLHSDDVFVNEDMNKLSIDPLFNQHILNFRGEIDDSADYWRFAPTQGETLRTQFQVQLPHQASMRLWPHEHCLLSIYLRNDQACSRRLLVWQDHQILICAMVETNYHFDIVAGDFFSDSNPFSLDRKSEIHAIGYHRLAQRLIARQTTDILSPMLSYDLGSEIGLALAKKVNASAAEQFLDGLVAALLSAAPSKKN